MSIMVIEKFIPYGSHIVVVKNKFLRKLVHLIIHSDHLLVQTPLFRKSKNKEIMWFLMTEYVSCRLKILSLNHNVLYRNWICFQLFVIKFYFESHCSCIDIIFSYPKNWMFELVLNINITHLKTSHLFHFYINDI